MNETQFREQSRALGYGELQELKIEADSKNDMHSHDFSAYALVLSGTFTLITEDGAVTHQPGEACTLAAGTLHAEQAGSDGACILVGKK